MRNGFCLKGDICYSGEDRTLCAAENGFLVVEDGVVKGVFDELPEEYSKYPLIDHTGRLVVPGLVDLHIHAPQYTFRGLGMDMELLEWLETNTFPEESRYRDIAYAREAYSRFAEDMKKGFTTRAVVFGTVHREATLLLMELMEKSGIFSYVGKVNMDRNAPDYLKESNAKESLAETRAWLHDSKGRFPHTKPILTPRFTPSCTDELMKGLGELQQEYHLPVQSHLSENPGEIAWVRELCPNTRFYGEAYDQFGLFGGENCPTVMAHCVYSSEEETALMKERGVYVAHCPASNTNIASGIAPIRRYLTEGLLVGLGSDVAGGHTASIFRAMADAVQVSKLRWRLVDDSLKPLTAEEAFYLGTLGGGRFFGKVGTFAEGYAADILVLDDSRHTPPHTLSPRDRLERMLYLATESDLLEKYVAGEKIC